MKKILFSPAGKIHPSQHNLINYPPEGYEFVVQKSRLDSMVHNSVVFDKLRLQVLDRLMPLNLVKGIIDSKSIPEDVDLVYAYNHVVLGKPYVVHVEWAHILAGRGPFQFKLWGHYIDRLLRQPSCKRILTWTQLARESISNLYSCTLDFKVNTIPPASPSKRLDRNYNRDKVRLLFMGSANQANDFEEKGGWDALRVFATLRERYGKTIELIIRAKSPRHISKNIVGVTWIENYLTEQELDTLYKEADIFFFPSHLYQNTSVIEAMSYGLPVVTTLIGSSQMEYVEDQSTGLVIADGSVFFRNGFPITETTNRHRFIKSIQALSYDRVEWLANATSQLIESPNLRKQLGENGKKEVDEGKFSIRRRNERLKEIFDEALA